MSQAKSTGPLLQRHSLNGSFTVWVLQWGEEELKRLKPKGSLNLWKWVIRPRLMSVCLKPMGQFVSAVISMAQSTQQFRQSSSQFHGWKKYKDGYRPERNLRRWILDEEMQKLCTINTYEGLFLHPRLPLWITSSPASWQRFIEQVSAGSSDKDLPLVTC